MPPQPLAMQTSFFDLDNRYAHLSKSGDPLERLNTVIDWELFRPVLNQIDDKERKSNAGRKPTDRVLMFKMLVLQNKYNLSDEQLEFQVTDRLSFARFLGVMLEGSVPDARTVWAFRDALKEKDLMGRLMSKFDEALIAQGVKLNNGQIVDATFVPVPIQRNSKESNEQIKAGQTPEHWAEQPGKECQKDVDARWTKKAGQTHYGYKNHINIDAATKIITSHTTTAANVHDSQELAQVLRPVDKGGAMVYADSAYRSEEIEEKLAQSKHESQIHERAYRNKPLTEAQEVSNTAKSRIRARVEHVFGYMDNAMGGNNLRSIGLARAKVGVALKNLTYNLCRVEILIRQAFWSFKRLTMPEMGLAR